MKTKNTMLILLLLMCTTLPCRPQDDESVYSLRQSIRQIHNQTEDKESIETQDANARVQNDEDTGKTVAKEIMSQAPANNSISMYTTGYRCDGAVLLRPSRMSRSYLLQRLALQEAQKETAQQANAANQFYVREANSEKAYTLQKQRKLEDSALGLEQQVVGSPDEDGTQIQPLGTNLYVRNYITPPRPIIELVATQKKLQHH